jgi:hypothetical protein
MVVILLAGGLFMTVYAAMAKDFGPGDLFVCNARHCVPIESRAMLPLLSRFYYSGHQPLAAPAVRIGAPAFELRFPPKSQGYVTGIVATARLDRFLSFGVNMDRFAKSVWYRVPAQLALQLRRLTAELRPFRVTPGLLRKSN